MFMIFLLLIRRSDYLVKPLTHSAACKVKRNVATLIFVMESADKACRAWRQITLGDHSRRPFPCKLQKSLGQQQVHWINVFVVSLNAVAPVFSSPDAGGHGGCAARPQHRPLAVQHWQDRSARGGLRWAHDALCCCQPITASSDQAHQ